MEIRHAGQCQGGEVVVFGYTADGRENDSYVCSDVDVCYVSSRKADSSCRARPQTDAVAAFRCFPAGALRKLPVSPHTGDTTMTAENRNGLGK